MLWLMQRESFFVASLGCAEELGIGDSFMLIHFLQCLDIGPILLSTGYLLHFDQPLS